MGMIFRLGASGIRAHLFVDSSYGVHVDGRSDTGTCVVIGDLGAVHCRSSKQTIVTKSSASLPRRSWWDYRTQRLSDYRTLPSELPVTTGVQHAGSHSVPG
jgi:hypothetical protein